MAALADKGVSREPFDLEESTREGEVEEEVTTSTHLILYCIVLYCIVLYFIVLYCIILYCIVLYCNVLYCIVCVCTYVCL